eukprot:1503492-Lingulodinium_polyedra.AAC.1
MTEIDFDTRRETGDIRLLIIPRTTKVCIRAAVLAHVRRGSLVFTDSHRSYSFLRVAGYVHRAVNH